ncbi:toll-like receptor 2 isoform X1 [Chrysemys picta bellii]|uniref:toll-like receptor 2 isoform X1 n=1 Tax=Chrysemys picta bellii TaxID=8478 RepID=UPI0032B1B678
MRPLAGMCIALCVVIVGLADGADPCLVTADNKVATCKGQNLNRVPQHLPRTLLRLDLSYNRLKEIAAGDFSALTQLQSLDLGYNNISRISADAFASNVLLEELSLFNNSLRWIPSPALKPLRKLRRLEMSNNLYLRSTLDEVFSTLRNLQEFSMGGSLIQTVGKWDFLPLKNIALQKFALKTASSLLKYQNGAFSVLNTTALWCDIALDKNPKALPMILRDLRGKPLQYLRFRNLFEFTYYTEPADLFSGLAEVQASKLVFYRGKFNENLLRLALLNIQKSRIRDLSLMSIDFARSSQWNRSETGITNLTLGSLLLQDISNPDILRFDWTFTWFSGVANLSILNVNFNFVPCDTWDEMRNVVTLDVSNNRLKDAYIYNQGCNYQDVLPKLERFLMAKNELTSLGIVAKLTANWPRLTHINASHNHIGGLKETACQWNPGLVWLALDHNTVTMEIFKCLPITLHYLDLSYSELDRLEMSYFVRCQDLQELKLSGNKIKFIPSEWRCPSLRILAMDGNSFGVISEGSFVNMPELTSLKAGNNPYHCTCDLYGFLQETRRKGKLTLLDWPEGWTCYHPESLLDMGVSAYTPGLTECDVRVVVAISVSITAVVIIATMVLCWKFDVLWYLQATYRIIRSKYRARHAQPARAYAYHAFISYSCSDADWVRQELLQRLESSSPPYRICIHERDFTPGKWIIDNIIENIESSYKVIFVLSRSFVDSEWCNYELYFAHQRAVGLGYEDVILVVKEAIDPQSLPNKFCKLRKMLSTKTYLEWPSEPSRQPFFWIQLRNVLGKPGAAEPGHDRVSLASVELGSGEAVSSPAEEETAIDAVASPAS